MNDVAHSQSTSSGPRLRLDVPSHKNYHALALDYAVLALVMTSSVVLLANRTEWGIPLGVLGPILLAAILVIGAIQHRLACLVHEAAHYTLFKKRERNNWLTDLLCALPLLSTVKSYRKRHRDHHLYPNDWSRDPNLVYGGAHKLFHDFPMEKQRFVWAYLLRAIWPPFVLKHLWHWFQSLAPKAEPTACDAAERGNLNSVRQRIAPFLGPLWFSLMAISLACGNRLGQSWLVFAVPLTLIALAVATILMPPAPKDGRLLPLLQVAYYSILLCGLGWIRFFTGFEAGAFALLLWFLPLVTVFPYLMLMREIFQHANSDTGRLTNSRIIHAGPLSRWALLPYGQSAHLIHHLYPSVPHQHLMDTHQDLLRSDPNYAQTVEEVHSSPRTYPSILDAMARK